MAADDVAILVGISIYADAQYGKLDGPPNDVLLMKNWLLDKAGGDVPNENIITIESPAIPPVGIDSYDMPPRRDAFEREFNKLVAKRMALREARLTGRLYLYFSGHGFCNRSIDRDTEAALHAANASRLINEHIFGTFYARIAKGGPLFKETVLIMDCCRTSEINRQLLGGTANVTPDEMLSAQAKLMTIYAAPKGGQAQERQIKERGGHVYGLLTHALIKGLDEARPTNGSQIGSDALKALILQSWETVCGPDAPARPEIFPPSNGELFFGARNRGTEFTIKFGNPQPAGATFTLRNWKLERIADLSATGDPADDLVQSGKQLLSFKRAGGGLVLRLQPGLYEYSVSSGGQGTIKIPGEAESVTV